MIAMSLQIEETMKQSGCYVAWPHNRSEKLTLRCIIDPAQPGAFLKLRDWTQRSRSLLQQQLSNIKLARKEILHEIRAQVSR